MGQIRAPGYPKVVTKGKRASEGLNVNEVYQVCKKGEES